MSEIMAPVADEMNKNELKIQLKDLSKGSSIFVDAVKHFTSDVKDVLVNQFIEYTPANITLDYINFFKRKDKLQQELHTLQTHIQQVSEKSSLFNSKFKLLYEEFLLAANKFKYVSELGRCTKDIEVSSRLIERCQYNKAADLLEKLLEILEYPVNYKDLVAIVNSMKDVVSFKHVKCLFKITEQWRSRLTWSENFTNKGHIINVEMNVSDPENLQDILNALSSAKRINVELTRFARFVIKCAMPALLTKTCTVSVRESLHNFILEIEYSDEIKECDDIKTVLKNLITFFGTIQSNIDCRWEDNRTVFSILGQLLGKEFFTMLKEYCLQNLVTIDEDKVDTYLPIAAEIEKFGEYLHEINFTDKGSSPLQEFTKDTLRLICDRRCKVLLETARCLMETNLQQDIVEVCTNQNLDICLDEIKLLEKDNYLGRNITDCPYLLPRCCISISCKKILQLVVEQVNVAHNSSPTMANRILITVRNIFELYIALVPEIHAEEVDNSPLDLALFYNNCFYLAHGMLGHPWSTIFHKEFATNLNMILSDMVQNFRRVAIVKLATFVKKQRQFIVKTIETSELTNLSKVDCVNIDSCPAINKCLDLLIKFQRLWQPVLPQSVYEKTMTNLISCLAEELVQSVLTVKENVIAEDVIMSVVILYKPIIDSVPKLFKDPISPETISQKWMRFVELTSLLECQMFGIASRWNDESGKLRNLFTTEEITNLIRILFSNNKRKVNVLEMIK